MTTYLGEKAVGIGTVKATIGVAGNVLHDSTLKGNGNTEPLGVDTEVIATATQVGNLATTLHAAIDGQAEAIAKTRNDFEVADQAIRADMNEKDSELEHMINKQAAELTTLRGNQASLGDQVSNIESKIPQSASGTNHLITKQQLLDEEMDIRDDLNETSSELQTQITSQASEIAKLKQEVAGLSSMSLEIVDELPAVGKERIIYLVPSGGEAPNLRDEYVWVNGAFEVIGSTQIDLTGYVKNTDYATREKGGVITIYPTYGTDISTSNGYLRGVIRTLEQHIASNNLAFISKGTLENIKDDYVKRGITENTTELTDEEKASAKSWLGFADGADINEVTAVIPATANPDNQLADQGFVNSSIQTSTAHFRGNWDTWADVPSDAELYPADAHGNHAPTPNDYLVVVADEQHDGGTWRYKYTGLWSEQGKDGWQAEYQVNETPLTAAQLAALNSGVTEDDVASFVKNTDYATSANAGLVRCANTYGMTLIERGLINALTVDLDTYSTCSKAFFIGKGTLGNVLTQYSKAPTVTEQNENSVELADNTIYNATEIASLTITFPTVDLKYTSQLNFTSGATATAFTAPATIKWAGDSIVNGAFVPETNKRYVILFYYDGVNICAIAKGE